MAHQAPRGRHKQTSRQPPNDNEPQGPYPPPARYMPPPQGQYAPSPGGYQQGPGQPLYGPPPQGPGGPQYQQGPGPQDASAPPPQRKKMHRARRVLIISGAAIIAVTLLVAVVTAVRDTSATAMHSAAPDVDTASPSAPPVNNNPAPGGTFYTTGPAVVPPSYQQTTPAVSPLQTWCQGPGGSDLEQVESDLNQLQADSGNDDVAAAEADGAELYRDAALAVEYLPPLQKAHKLDYGLYMGFVSIAGYRVSTGDNAAAITALQSAAQFKRLVDTVDDDCND
jgi:hypothetical protein